MSTIYKVKYRNIDKGMHCPIEYLSRTWGLKLGKTSWLAGIKCVEPRFRIGSCVSTGFSWESENGWGRVLWL